jgi:hypothetical protein
LERGDLPHVASLCELLLGTGSRTPRAELAPFLERTLLDHPWTDAEIPSLVHVEGDGRVTGFVASQLRRMRFDGDPIRMVCVSHLVSDPGSRTPIGALLLRHVLRGPQELTITDTGTETVRAMWERLGAETIYTNCVNWRRLLRPWSFAAGRLSVYRRGPRSQPGRALRAASAGLDAATSSLAPGLLGVGAPAADVETLRPAALREHLSSVAAGLRLVPDWDADFLEWLFEELVRRDGELGASLVTSDGRPIGWFVYQLPPTGNCQVIEVAARRDREGTVLDHLFREVQARGATSLEGRVEPRLLEPLSRRRCIFRYGVAMVAHSGSADILHAIDSGRALLTRLEGEYVGIF